MLEDPDYYDAMMERGPGEFFMRRYQIANGDINKYAGLGLQIYWALSSMAPGGKGRLKTGNTRSRGTKNQKSTKRNRKVEKRNKNQGTIVRTDRFGNTYEISKPGNVNKYAKKLDELSPRIKQQYKMIEWEPNTKILIENIKNPYPRSMQNQTPETRHNNFANTMNTSSSNNQQPKNINSNTELVRQVITPKSNAIKSVGDPKPQKDLKKANYLIDEPNITSSENGPRTIGSATRQTDGTYLGSKGKATYILSDRTLNGKPTLLRKGQYFVGIEGLNKPLLKSVKVSSLDVIQVSNRGSPAKFKAKILAAGKLRDGDVGHHLVPINCKLADPARRVLENYNIKWEGSENGLGLSKNFHTGSHGPNYSRIMNVLILDAEKYGGRKAVVEILDLVGWNQRSYDETGKTFSDWVNDNLDLISTN